MTDSNSKDCPPTSDCVLPDPYTASLLILSTTAPFFIRPYENDPASNLSRQIGGKEYTVWRYNHGTAHSVRQGQLAKDIVEMLVMIERRVGEATGLQLPELSSICKWACEKVRRDPSFLTKIELASSFQRSGRMGEHSGSTSTRPAGAAGVDPEFLKYERRDSANFLEHARHVGVPFADEGEYRLFGEALLWFLRGEGTISEDAHADLKYIRQILRAAHTFDLRRVLTFNCDKIVKDGIVYLLQLHKWPVPCNQDVIFRMQRFLWHRSGAYLKATGDRYLPDPAAFGGEGSRMCGDFTDAFWLQNEEPETIVRAVHSVRNSQPIDAIFFL